MSIDLNDRIFLNHLRGISIIVIVAMHLGLSWAYLPYTQYFDLVVPVFFFISGATTWNSIAKNPTRKLYFFNRYISLITPFFAFSCPFLILALINSETAILLESIKWLIAWPSRSIFPFDMRQLWFINALIITFVICYPFLVLALKIRLALATTLILSIAYIPLSEHYNLIEFYYDIDLLNNLDLPMQAHQALSLSCFYLFGAFAFDRYNLRISHLVLILTLCVFIAFYSYNGTLETQSLRVAFFERNTYFVSTSFIFLTLLLLTKNYLFIPAKKLNIIGNALCYASKHSYSIFLIHTPIIFVFEEYIGFINLSESIVLALIKLFGVLTSSLLLAPLLTRLSNHIVKLFTDLTQRVSQCR